MHYAIMQLWYDFEQFLKITGEWKCCRCCAYSLLW